MTPHRIAMLQCEHDTRDECHSYHYAPFMDDCDPMVLKEVWPSSYQFHTDLNHPNEFANCERIDGFEIATVWDCQSLERAETFSRYVDRAPRVCATLEEAIEADQPYVLDVQVTQMPRIRATGHWDANDLLPLGFNVKK